MPSNVEIKARVHDFAALTARAALLSDEPVRVIAQVDTFFRTTKGRLKLRELKGGPAQLIYYERPDQDGPKRSDYSIFETGDAQALQAVLSMALGVRGTVEKTRHLYLIGQTRVHLDDVKGLGQFMELEVVLRPGQDEEEGRRVAQGLLSDLGIDRADLLESAYMDLLEKAP
jgi:predicted adenylyl cyclase CyaB